MNNAAGLISERVQILSLVGSASLLLIIIYLIRKGYLKTGYSLLWFLIVGLITILSMFSDILFWLSNLIGIEYAPAALFLVLLIGLMFVSIHFSIVISKHEKRIKKLAQDNALLKERLKKK